MDDHVILIIFFCLAIVYLSVGIVDKVSEWIRR